MVERGKRERIEKGSIERIEIERNAFPFQRKTGK